MPLGTGDESGEDVVLVHGDSGLRLGSSLQNRPTIHRADRAELRNIYRDARRIHASPLGIAYGVIGRAERADPCGGAVGRVAGNFATDVEVPLAVRSDDVGV